MKISILLPYKENFSPDYPGAVSLFVKDTVKISKYKNKITVYGNTSYKKGFKIKYKNLNLQKKFLNSTSKIYIKSFLDEELKNKSDIIEIHNRPNYLSEIVSSGSFNSFREIAKKMVDFFPQQVGETAKKAENIARNFLNQDNNIFSKISY